MKAVQKFAGKKNGSLGVIAALAVVACGVSMSAKADLGLGDGPGKKNQPKEGVRPGSQGRDVREQNQRGGGGLNGGNITVARTKIWLDDIVEFLRSPYGRERFPEVRDEFFGKIEGFTVALTDKPLIDRFGYRRSCVNQPETRKITCNPSSWQLNGQEIAFESRETYVLFGHELFGIAGGIEDNTEENPFNVTVSSRIAREAHFGMAPRWYLGPSNTDEALVDSELALVTRLRSELKNGQEIRSFDEFPELGVCTAVRPKEFSKPMFQRVSRRSEVVLTTKRKKKGKVLKVSFEGKKRPKWNWGTELAFSSKTGLLESVGYYSSWKRVGDRLIGEFQATNDSFVGSVQSAVIPSRFAYLYFECEAVPSEK